MTLPFDSIDVDALARRLPSEAETLQLIDVREPDEVAIASLPGFQVLPLSQYQDWAAQIHQRFETERETIVMCHHGTRSARMCQWLVQQGFTNVKNLSGGIDAYACQVDPSIPRY
ncbi:Thiosulfate sulfurtransferase GlpE [Halomicronema hongdechloris C2206]|uniref:Thiosulfate sulfurtransferase GlpE n=1 Tax=Halomicronema hongdechloris C2206 TaxID=1641165 RepID=A0A1Z3HFP2_9CYAN|nr:rhodanese-like domain-containing protein [Halomicronema hongdechloris]ASC69098.1 Thiosulfate sulfurtransferase GlpE [Halomicronema hongdechloris C2206]